MCDETHHKSFGLGSTAVDEVHRHIVFILEDRFFLIPMAIQLLWIMAI